MPTPSDGVVLDQGGAVYKIDSTAYGDLADSSATALRNPVVYIRPIGRSPIIGVEV